MSNSADFEVHREAIEAYPIENLLKRSIPMAVYFAEAETLAKVVDEDEDRLIGAGIKPEMIAGLPSLIGAARESQSIWTANRFGREEVEKEWGALLPEAYELRDEILHGFRYAFRNDEQLLGRVKAIAEGNGSSDLIQDLNDVSVLGREQESLLLAIAFDMAKLSHAADTSDRLANLLAEKESGRDVNQHRVIRDKAYSLLKESVDEIYACGQYLFYKEEKRKRQYSSDYMRERNRRQYQDRKAKDEA